MKRSFLPILVLALLAGGISLFVAACDNLRSSTSEKDAQVVAKPAGAVAYVKNGNAAIFDSEKGELRNRFEKAVKVAKRGSGESLISMRDVSFEYATNPSRIVAKAKDASGNCLLTSFRLEESSTFSNASTQSESGADYMALTNSSDTCTGDPCTLCQENYNGGGEFTGCSCEGEGRDGEEGFCNHSTGDIEH